MTDARIVSLEAPSNQGREFLDHFLLKGDQDLSLERARYLIDHGHVSRDGATCRDARSMVAPGETIRFDLAPEPLDGTGKTLEILFHDDSILALNKPPGLASVPSRNRPVAAEDLLLDQFDPGSQMPILLHRLDADTSGLLLFAMNPVANRELAAQFANREIRKRYLALVEGEAPERFEIDNRLLARSGGRTVASKRGKKAFTEFRRLCSSRGYSLMEAFPHTGRTHQIRVHLADAGFPIVGDTYYGGKRYCRIDDETVTVKRQLLHAASATLTHPGNWAPLELTASLPDDYRCVLERAGFPAAAISPLRFRES